MPARADALQLDGRGIGFELIDRRRSAHAVQSPLLGRFNVDNLLAVAGVLCMRWAIAAGAIAEVLSALQPIRGRMEPPGR